MAYIKRFDPAGAPVKIEEGFARYLDDSVRNPFVLDLKDKPLMEVIDICVGTKLKAMPRYGESLGGLVYNLRILERDYKTQLMPVQITDIFWCYFIDFCKGRGLRLSSVRTMAHQLKSILTWASRYNCSIAPSYSDVRIDAKHKPSIALSADDVSRITYFDVDRFYKDRRADYLETMRRVRDMFVLSCNLYQRYSDMVRIAPECFDGKVFKIAQQKTGNMAVVNIDRFSIEPKTTMAILKRYGYRAPYTATIGNYNWHLHDLMRDIGLTEPVRVEEKIDGYMVTNTVPRWQMVSSHTARRTAITVGVLRGHNIHDLKRCSGHVSTEVFDEYIKDDYT